MLVDFLIDGLVLHFVKVNTLQKIVDCLVTFDILVVGRVNFDFFYVGLDHFRVVAQRLDKKQTKTKVLRTIVTYEIATFARRIRRVEYLLIKKFSITKTISFKHKLIRKHTATSPSLFNQPHMSSRACLAHMLQSIFNFKFRLKSQLKTNLFFAF